MTTMPSMTPPPPEAITRPTAWPRVVGIIAIVFGALAAMGGCIGLIMTGIMPPLMEKLEDTMPPPGAGGPTTVGVQGLVAYAPELLGFQAVYLLVSLLLVTGGVMLVRRRRAAAALCLTWAGLKIAYSVGYAFLNYRVNVTNFEAMQHDPNLSGIFSSSFFPAMIAAGVVVQTLWYCALPVFMIVWFSRPKVREEMATWGTSAPAVPPAETAPPTDTPLS